MEEDDGDNTYYFVGQVIPALDPDQDPRAVEHDQFHHTHARDIELRDLPILFEHGMSEEFGEKPLGRVMQSWLASDGSKKIMGTIDCSTEAGKRAAAKVASGEIGELSIKHDSFKFNGRRTEIQGRRGIEVSLTEKGDFPNSRIIHKFGTRNFEMQSPAEVPVGTPLDTQQQQAPPPAVQQQQQAPPAAVQQQQAPPPVVQQQQQQDAAPDFENMSMEELLAQARSTEMTKEEFADMSAHLARALQNAQRSLAEMERKQAESRTQEISKDVQEYIELMQSMGVQVDPQLADLLLGKKGGDTSVLRQIAHTISAHSAGAKKAAQERDAKTAMIEAENAKLKGKVEKYKTASSSSNFRRHLEHLAGRTNSRDMYSNPSNVQRFAPSAFERAAHDAGVGQNDYLKQAEKNLRNVAQASIPPPSQAQAQQQQAPPQAQASMPPAQHQQPPRFDLSGFASHLQQLAGTGI